MSTPERPSPKQNQPNNNHFGFGERFIGTPILVAFTSQQTWEFGERVVNAISNDRKAEAAFWTLSATATALVSAVGTHLVIKGDRTTNRISIKPENLNTR